MSRENWLTQVEYGKIGVRMPHRLSSGLGCIEGLMVGLPLSLFFWVGAYVVGDIWL